MATAMAGAEPTLQGLIDGLGQGGERTLVQAWGREAPTSWSYGQVHREVDALARGLCRSLEPGEPVALFAQNGPEWLLAALAIVRAGAIVVPVDVQSDAEGLGYILGDAGARWVFAGARYANMVREAHESPRIVRLGSDAPAGDDPHWRDLTVEGEDDLPDLPADATAVLFYTSGTTGPPKGVPLSHANLGYQLGSLRDSGIVEAGDRVLLPLPLHHVYAFSVGALTPIFLGLTLVMPYALTGQQLLRAIREGRVTVIVGVPRLYEALYDGMAGRAADAGYVARVAFESAVGVGRAAEQYLGVQAGRWLAAPMRRQVGPALRVLASGGSPLDEDLAWKLEALGLQVGVGYGLTETSPLLTINPPGRGPMGSVGRPVPGTRVRIDPEPLEGGGHRPGEGEIQATGPGVFSGYHRRQDKTRSAFTDDGWYRTGDLGYCDDDGYLYVTGRLSTMLVTRSGENVQPDALEQRYTRHPAIREIGILEREGRLVALVVPEGDDAPLKEALAETGRELATYQRLADYRATRQPLPRTRLGKIRRHELEERYDQAGQETEAAHAEPQKIRDMTADDRALLEQPAAARAWECLAAQYPDAGLSLDADPRLDLGMDSMDWLNLTLEIGERTGVELDEGVIDRVETVRDLLGEVVEAAPAEHGPESPLENPEQQLSSSQRRWLEPRGAVLGGTARGLHALDRALMRSLFRLRVQGLERVPPEGPFVLLCNHQSYLDPFALAASLPYGRLRTLYWGGWTGAAFSNPVRRMASRAAQVVPVDPYRGARSSLTLAAAVLDAGQGLIWFPEGERSSTGELQQFRPGIGMLLERYPVPVVLATLDGTRQAMPVGRRLPRPQVVEVSFADVVDTATLQDEGQGDGPAARIVDALESRMGRLRKT